MNKLLKNKFRANKLIKYLFKDSSLLQLKLTLFKELTLSLTNKIINVGSKVLLFKERFKNLNVEVIKNLRLLAYLQLLHFQSYYL